MKKYKGVEVPDWVISIGEDPIFGDLIVLTDADVDPKKVDEFIKAVENADGHNEAEFDYDDCYEDVWMDGYKCGMNDSALDLPVRAIFNNPATILFWPDGTKTVSKCVEGDIWDREKGVMAAMLRKYLGYGWFERVEKLIPPIPDGQKNNQNVVFHKTGILGGLGLDEVMCSVESELHRHKQGLIEVADLLRKLADE